MSIWKSNLLTRARQLKTLARIEYLEEQLNETANKMSKKEAKKEYVGSIPAYKPL